MNPIGSMRSFPSSDAVFGLAFECWIDQDGCDVAPTVRGMSRTVGEIHDRRERNTIMSQTMNQPSVTNNARRTCNWGYRQLLPLAGTTIGSHLTDKQKDAFRNMVCKRDKGAMGKVTEMALGLPQNSRLLDFCDGDLKTTKVTANGRPTERLVISQAGIVAEIFDVDEPVPFHETKTFRKMRKMVLMGVCKDAPDPCDWQIVFVRLLDFNENPMASFIPEFESTYAKAVMEMLGCIAQGQPLHGTGRRQNPIIQLCQHDSGGNRNHPMVSERYGVVSPMRRAWAIPPRQLARILDAI